MTAFRAPVDDIVFSLHQIAVEFAGSSHDTALAHDVIAQFAALAEGVVAPTNRPGDIEGCQVENGRVRVPRAFHDAYRQLADGGWLALTVPQEFGGMGLDRLTAAGVSEILTGANHALQMSVGLLPGAVSTLLRFGTEAQQQTWIPRLADGRTLNTMCLTEPGAGSDLSQVRTRAMHDGGAWRISGEKIFISGGDQDLSEDILHFVLARSGPPESGTRGLSLFACPARIGTMRNNVSVTRVEEKLGIHGSPTCQLLFEDAEAELLGEEGGGLAAMFTLMNHARLDVALQGVAHAARAFDIAASYAADRVQGRNADGAAATLSEHADIRQMLDEQRALAMGSRTMCHIALAVVEGDDNPALAEFLTPICKMFASEAGIRAADLGIQVLGGYGYLEDYEMAQIWRDARITAIYEGANGIHAVTTATRGLRARGGAGADAFLALVDRLADGHTGLAGLRQDWQALRAAILADEGVPDTSRQFANLTAELFFRACWVRIAGVSDKPGDSDLCKRLLSAPSPAPRLAI